MNKAISIKKWLNAWKNLKLIGASRGAGKDEGEKVELIKTIQILLVNLEAGCPLEKSLKNALGTSFEIKGSSYVESLNTKSVAMNDKDLFRFVRLINQYHLNGSQNSIIALEKLLGELYSRKMADIKKKAEKATIKLTVLLMLSLFSIIIVVVTPVIVMLKSNL